MNHLLAFYLTKPSLSQNSTGGLPLGKCTNSSLSNTINCLLHTHKDVNNDDKESVLWKIHIVVGDEPRVKQAVLNISLQALMK